MIVVGLPSSKKIKRNNTKKMIVQFIKLKSAEKGEIPLACVVSTSTAKNTLKGVLVTKEDLKSDLNTMLNLIRDKKFVDFRRIRKYFEDSAWAKCLKLFDKKKKFKMVLFGLPKNICHEY